jgi:hypothetical protein
MSPRLTSGAKALLVVSLYGTANLSRRAVEAVPFVERFFSTSAVVITPRLDM